LTASRTGIPSAASADILEPEILSTYDFSALPSVARSSGETASSTNELAKQLAFKGAQHPTVVAAEQQTGGKGRMGRSWKSEKGKSLTFSIILRLL
jgi:BirA family biotin operon repressor/biotin-[acetyl-CoA-carboxylase] ligase